MTTENGKPKFKEAFSQLEQITQDLQGGDVDLDDLVEKVKTAAGLIKFCKDELQSAEKQISEIIKDVEGTTKQTTGKESVVSDDTTEYAPSGNKDDDLPF